MKPKSTPTEYSTPQLLWQFLRGSKRFFALTIVSALGMTLTEMVAPQVFKFAIDSVLGNTKPTLPAPVMTLVDRMGGVAALRTHLWWIAVVFAALALVGGAFQYAFRVFNTRSSETLVETMRNMIFAHIQRLPFCWHIQNQTGDVIQRCTSDVSVVRNFLSEQLTQILRIVALIVTSIIFMATLNLRLTVVALIIMPVIAVYSALYHHHIGAAFRAADEKEGKLSAIAQENLTGVRVVRAFGREMYERERFEKCDADYSQNWMRVIGRMCRYWTTSSLISGTGLMLIVVLGAVLCVKGTMTGGAYIAFISYYGMLTWPMRQLGRMISEMSKAGVSIERIKHIINSAPEADAEDALTPDMTGDIVFDNVSYSYTGAKQNLDHISFTVPGGSTVGILGATGSGKSTLMCLLDQLYELPAECGKITVGGVDIAHINRAYLRRNIGYVLQEPYLFSRTIAENISIGEQMSMEQIEHAASVACLDENIKSFSAGYDTFVGERGVTLSGGQKQRAAIARMIARPCPIMILDDSLSAVDTETDAKIRAALLREMGGSTVFLISHRLTTLMHADQIIVMEKGKIIEAGTHAELLAQNGVYRKIYEIQSAREAE